MDPSGDAQQSQPKRASTPGASQSSQTAQQFIASQLQLEADAREALPYQFDTCTKPLGSLRQSIFACLTCTPPPASRHQQLTPAGVCYSCSISCHGEHTLVELFCKRNFECDCGTTRFVNGATCELRLNPATGRKGGVSGEQPRIGNKYDHNYEGKFCGCGEEYDPEREKGTMFQCLGLGTVEDGGCGEDWWHPECLMGLPRMKHETNKKSGSNGELETVKEEGEEGRAPANGSVEPVNGYEDEPPLPEGFPAEDDFDHLICYKCADAYPWIKQYSGTGGFLSALPFKSTRATDLGPSVDPNEAHGAVPSFAPNHSALATSNKRKADDEVKREDGSQSPKKMKGEDAEEDQQSMLSAAIEPVSNGTVKQKHDYLPPAPAGSVSIFVNDDFRDHLCRCADCFSRLKPHPQLLEEEESYEPPISEADPENDNVSVTGRSVNSGSLLERGEAALSGMDRVRAIEGVMAYNHVRDKVKAFLKPYAESGEAVGAEDIKAYFTKLRGDEAAEKAAGGSAAESGAVQGDGRKEQDGY